MKITHSASGSTIGLMLVMALSGGCGDREQPVKPASVPDRATPPPAATAGDTTTYFRPGFHTLEPIQLSSFSEDSVILQARVRPIGYVYVTGAAAANPDTVPDLLVHADSSRASAVVAYMGGAYLLAVAEPGLKGELERVSHEEYGLPVDTLLGPWARVVYGYTQRGERRSGWVRVVGDSVAFVSYDQQIRRHLTMLTDPRHAELFIEPGGQRSTFSLADPSSEDTTAVVTHDVAVLEVRPDWVKLMITVPDTTACTGDMNAKVQKREYVWVPKVTARGAYNVWYAAAGC